MTEHDPPDPNETVMEVVRDYLSYDDVIGGMLATYGRLKDAVDRHDEWCRRTMMESILKPLESPDTKHSCSWCRQWETTLRKEMT